MVAAPFFHIAGPHEDTGAWHVAPFVDVVAYAFSWVWILVPMLFLGSERSDYLVCFLVTIVLTDVHRHYGLPYVYLDGEVLRRYPRRFSLMPALLFAAFCATPYIVLQRTLISVESVFAGLAATVLVLRIFRREAGQRPDAVGDLLGVVAPSCLLAGLVGGTGVWSELGLPAPAWAWLAALLFSGAYLDRASPGRWRPSASTVAIAGLALGAGLLSPTLADLLPRGAVRSKELFSAIAIGAGIWNFWHVYAQKYGILRIYAAKTGEPARTPPWIDRLMIFAWLPLYFAWLAPSYREQAYRNFAQARGIIPTLAEWLEWAQPVTVPLAVAFLVGALAIFARSEWRANRFRNGPRAAMAAGLCLLGASFLVFDPVKVYLAFAFSHAVEYMVFVWAFQRRRYRDRLPHDPLLGRMLRRPVASYLVFTGVLGALVLYAGYFGRSIFTEYDRPELFGIRTSVWIMYWTVYQSLVHFYYDGFLWKTRHRSLAETL